MGVGIGESGVRGQQPGGDAACRGARAGVGGGQRGLEEAPWQRSSAGGPGSWTVPSSAPSNWFHLSCPIRRIRFSYFEHRKSRWHASRATLEDQFMPLHFGAWLVPPPLMLKELVGLPWVPCTLCDTWQREVLPSARTAPPSQRARPPAAQARPCRRGRHADRYRPRQPPGHTGTSWLGTRPRRAVARRLKRPPLPALRCSCATDAPEAR